MVQSSNIPTQLIGTPTQHRSTPTQYGGTYTESAMPDLPEFFRGIPMVEEVLEDIAIHENDDLQNDIDRIPPLENGNDDENITLELLEFFHGVDYDNMAEFFQSFEYGDSWCSNPVFTDEFAFCALPKALSDMLYEIHVILQIQRVVPHGWNRNDARYSSLSEPQQTHLRELIHANHDQYNQLDDIHNRLKGYINRTPYPQIKFLLIKTLDVVQDILRKEELAVFP